jgi:hypothetical protein
MDIVYHIFFLTSLPAAWSGNTSITIPSTVTPPFKTILNLL